MALFRLTEMSERTDIAIDRNTADAASKLTSEHTDADILRDELRAVVASPDFARAPIMKRLLSFLVGETAAGRGDQLKAYSVAVDGLGRAPDYDSRADSYPRVQVGRLRRMLDNYYSATPPSTGLRLTIPSGRYKVTLQSPHVPPEKTEPEPEPRCASMIPEQPLRFGWQVALLLLLLIAATAALLRVVPSRAKIVDAGHERPLLELGSVGMVQRSELGTLIHATLMNGLSRSTMYDLRSDRPLQSTGRPPVPALYRLSADLSEGERPRLFLRLTGTSPERLVWSGDITLEGRDLDSEALDRVLAPVIATIGRVNGLVATHQLQDHGRAQPVGHACVLLYHHYRTARTERELDHVRSCVERSLNLDPRNAELQAAAAQLAIERMVSSATEPRERPALLLIARRHSQIAASIDPLSPWTNAARARIAVMRRACAQAISFALRASQRQPYDPTLLGDAGVYLLDCGDPHAEGLIRRAIALDDNPEGRFYGPLLLLAISRDDPALAREALTHMAPPVIGRHAHFYLTTAAGYAMIGDVGRARTAWAQLREGSPAVARDVKGFFERLGYSEHLRAKAVAHLRAAGLTGT